MSNGLVCDPLAGSLLKGAAGDDTYHWVLCVRSRAVDYGCHFVTLDDKFRYSRPRLLSIYI